MIISVPPLVFKWLDIHTWWAEIGEHLETKVCFHYQWQVANSLTGHRQLHQKYLPWVHITSKANHFEDKANLLSSSFRWLTLLDHSRRCDEELWGRGWVSQPSGMTTLIKRDGDDVNDKKLRTGNTAKSIFIPRGEDCQEIPKWKKKQNAETQTTNKQTKNLSYH